MKPRLLLPILVIAAITASFLFYQNIQKKQDKQPEVHFHAGVQVYIDGELQDFSDFKYMSVKPCGEEEEHVQTPEEEQKEKIHLHDNVGDVAHIHRPGVIWNDLFMNINAPLEDRGTVSGFVSGKFVEDILHQPIREYESAIIVISTTGNEQATAEATITEYVKNAVTKDHIVDSESASENCGTTDL